MSSAGSISQAFSIRKGNWNNTGVFSDLVYIEANPVLDMVLGRPLGPLVEDYLQENVRRGGMATWSYHTIDEVKKIIHIGKYADHAYQNGINDSNIGGKHIYAWKIAENTVDEATSQSISEDVENETEAVVSLLEQYGIETDVEQQKVRRLSSYLYRNFGGGPQDAMHVAIANLSGTNNILSQDSGLLRYPSQNIFGASRIVVSKYTPSQHAVAYVDLTQSLPSTEKKAEGTS